MDPLICLILGALLGSLVSGLLVWLATKPDQGKKSTDPYKVLRDFVGRGILPGHVWEQVSRELRLKNQTTEDANKKIASAFNATGYHTHEETAHPVNGSLGLKLVLGLWFCAVVCCVSRFNSSAWLLTTASALLSGAVLGILWNRSLLNHRGMRFVWFCAGVSAWPLAALGFQGPDADPQRLLFSGLAGLSAGLGAMAALETAVRSSKPGLLNILSQAALLFGPIFLLPADLGRWDSENRDWSNILPAQWILLAGGAWALSLAARQGFSSSGMVLGSSFAGCWIAGWSALHLSGTGQGRGLPAFALGAFVATALTAALMRFFAPDKSRHQGKFPTGSTSFLVSLFLAGCVTATAMARVGYPQGLVGCMFLAATLSSWLTLAFLGRNAWGLASFACLLTSVGIFSVLIHNTVPVIAWWPFMAKAMGLGLSLGALGWCLAQWRFPSRKSQPYVCAASFAGVVGWLLPTQALVLATLVEPSWMSEVIRAPLGGWWNLPLAVFSVGVAWWMHKSLPTMRGEIWLTFFILIAAGLATAWATLGLDNEESPQGVLAVLAAWCAGAAVLNLFRSRWSALFSNLFLGFAWFLAWSQASRLPGSSHFWSLAPALLAWITGSLHSLVHGKRWVPLAATGALMVGLSTWSAFASVNLGPGLLVGALLLVANLLALELRYNRDWLAPQGFRKSFRLREPAFWLGICQSLILAGSFLSIRESGHGGWLALALLAQTAVLWLIRGESSATLAHLQSLGFGMAGGLATLGLAKTLEGANLLEGSLGQIPSLAFFVPGTLLGLGIRQLLFALKPGSLNNGSQLALGLFGIPVGVNAVSAAFPTFDQSQWYLSLGSTGLWPVLAWIGAQLAEGKSGSRTRFWYQAALTASIIPLAMGAASIRGLEDFGLTQAALATLAGSTLAAGWCLLAPHLDIAWSLQARQAFAPAGRRILGAAALLQILLLMGAQITGNSGLELGDYLLALAGFGGCALVAGFLANEQRGPGKAMRVQGFCLASLVTGAAWANTVFAPTPAFARSTMVLLGMACLLLGSLKSPALARWRLQLHWVALALPLLVLMISGTSLAVNSGAQGVFAHWGIDSFADDWKPWATELSITGLVLGLAGFFGSSNHWHGAVRFAFLPWAIAGWVGLCVSTMGLTPQGILLAVAGLLAGIRLQLQNNGLTAKVSHPGIRQEAA